MAYPRLPFAALPFTRLELPGWGRVLRALRISVPPGDRTWSDAPTKTIRGKAHGYLMELELHDWAERMTFFLGRYYELPQQLLLERVLREGDRVVDVGGNIGMWSLLAAKLVGPSGLVETFEPNPACQERIRSVLKLNEIGWVRLHPCGLSDEPASLELTVVNNHSGVGTFTTIEAENESAVSDRVKAEVRVGDDALDGGRPIRLIKIDVEGFETRAVRGLRKTIERDRPIVVLEMIDGLLRKAGSSSVELFVTMSAMGYDGYALGTKRRGLGQELSLTRLHKPGASGDVVWVPAGTRI
jgi:FkbM family methyltransferase